MFLTSLLQRSCEGPLPLDPGEPCRSFPFPLPLLHLGLPHLSKVSAVWAFVFQENESPLEHVQSRTQLVHSPFVAAGDQFLLERLPATFLLSLLSMSQLALLNQMDSDHAA